MRPPLSLLRALFGAPIVALALACAVPVAASAADCGSAAQAACARAGCLKIFSYEDRGGTCFVTMLVPDPAGNPPRKVTVPAKG